MKKIIACIATLVIVISLPIISFAEPNRLDDQAGVLSTDEKAEAGALLDEVSNKYGIDPVVVITRDTQGKSNQAFADDYYDYGGYGFDGVLFLIDLTHDSRWISTKGEGIEAFTDYGIQLAGEDLKPLVIATDYFGAIKKFAEVTDKYFEAKRNGTPVDVPPAEKQPVTASDIIFTVVIALLIGFGISFIITGSMKKQMKTVEAATNANNYVEGNRIEITNSRDRYLYHHVAVVPIQQNNNRPGGGSSIHISSSGSTHGGGGF